MKKLLRHLTKAPVAVALAFLLVGAPSAPVANMMPSSGEALAYGCGGEMGGVAPPGPPDLDCDGLPDHDDPCPSDPMNTCDEAEVRQGPFVETGCPEVGFRVFGVGFELILCGGGGGGCENGGVFVGPVCESCVNWCFSLVFVGQKAGWCDNLCTTTNTFTWGIH